MIDVTKLSNMVLDLKQLEINMDENDYENDDEVLKYNELVDEIIDYLKQVL